MKDRSEVALIDIKCPWPSALRAIRASTDRSEMEIDLTISTSAPCLSRLLVYKKGSIVINTGARLTLVPLPCSTGHFSNRTYLT